jgi:hypothetical protein
MGIVASMGKKTIKGITFMLIAAPRATPDHQKLLLSRRNKDKTTSDRHSESVFP